jgi:hypothetical protein
MDLDAERREPLACGGDLPGLEGVLFAARDVERDGVSELARFP